MDNSCNQAGLGTPTLRNVATRRVCFHNGHFHPLKEALRFYVRRDTDPKSWYPVSSSGGVTKFDDLPTSLRGNVDIGRRAAQAQGRRESGLERRGNRRRDRFSEKL